MKKNNVDSYVGSIDGKNIMSIADELLLQQTYPPRIVKYEDFYAVQLFSYDLGTYKDMMYYTKYDNAKADFTNWTTAWNLIKRLLSEDISNARPASTIHYS